MIQLSIIQAGDEMGGAGTPGRQAHPDFAGELGVRDGHEGRHLLVPDLDEFDLVSSLQGSDHAVDAVTGISVDTANSPGMQAFNDEIADFHGKLQSSRLSKRFTTGPNARLISW